MKKLKKIKRAKMFNEMAELKNLRSTILGLPEPILLTTHVKPDADGVSACLGIYETLRYYGNIERVIVIDHHPDKLNRHNPKEGIWVMEGPSVTSLLIRAGFTSPYLILGLIADTGVFKYNFSKAINDAFLLKNSLSFEDKDAEVLLQKTIDSYFTPSGNDQVLLDIFSGKVNIWTTYVSGRN